MSSEKSRYPLGLGFKLVNQVCQRGFYIAGAICAKFVFITVCLKQPTN